jgi:hypothetical protein
VLRVLWRRGLTQLPLLGAVLGVVVLGASLLGVCALLLTTTEERAFDEGVSRAGPDDVEVTAYTTGVLGRDAASVLRDATGVVAGTLRPFDVVTDTRASSAMRELGDQSDGARVAYLSGMDDLEARAGLVAGRYPRDPGEAAVPETTAARLGLAPGDTVELGREVRPEQAPPVRLEIVGVVRPVAEAGWDRDPLLGEGYDPKYNDGRFTDGAQAYGPFLVPLEHLLAGGSTLSRLQVTAHPDLSDPTRAQLADVAAQLPRADARLSGVLGDRVGVERIDSRLPATLAVAREQQAVTRSTVLVVALLGTALTAAALALAGRLVAAHRSGEAALLATFGASRRQFLAAAAIEAAALAVLGALVAVPASSLVHTAVTGLEPLRRAGLTTGFVVGAGQVTAVVVGAAVLTALLVTPALRPDPAQPAPTRDRPALLARSGADVALAVLAGIGWWQLRSDPPTGTGARTDVVRVLAPALVLLAGSALALRLVAPPLRGADRLARRSPALVLPLAAFEAARRPQAVAAGLLLALAAAAATFGLAFSATWERSQEDQAEARVGTDLAVGLTTPAAPGQGRTLAAATGGVVSPATDRGVAVGQWVGGAGAPPRLVAVDTRHAGDLLRGRLPGDRRWADVAAPLAPRDRVGGIALRAGDRPGLTLTGTAAGAPLTVIPRLVLEDADGVRSVCEAAAARLDGRPHPVRVCGPDDATTRIVALSLRVEPTSGAPVESQDAFAVELRVPDGVRDPAEQPAEGTWPARSVGAIPQQITGGAARLERAPGATLVTVTGTAQLAWYPYERAELVSTAFAAPETVPVLVSRRLATELDATPGRQLTLTVGTTQVPVTVAGVVPAVPSAPSAVAMLADTDLLSRSLVTTGDLTPTVDGWWVGGPAHPDAEARVRALGLGDVVTREGLREELSQGPLRIGLPTALGVLVPAALLLALAGTLLHVTSDVEARALEVARLRGLGVSRADVLKALLAQHGIVLALLVLAGTAVGALAAGLVGPLLITSDVGGAPVPAAVAQWPWPAVGALVTGLLAGCTAAVALGVAVQVRRADAAHLRVGA